MSNVDTSVQVSRSPTQSNLTVAGPLATNRYDPKAMGTTLAARDPRQNRAPVRDEQRDRLVRPGTADYHGDHAIAELGYGLWL